MLLPTTIDGLFLRDLRMDDFDGFSSWQQDPEIARCFAFTRTPRTQDETRRVLAEIVGGAHPESVHLAIVLTGQETGKESFVGVVSLKNRHPIDRHAEFAIVIGAREHMGKGYGKAAARRMCLYGFEELRLRKIYLNVIADNVRAVRLYEELGFRFEGRFREHFFRDGVWNDLLWYSVFPSELR